jgi:cation diffusion facilitator family transporter
VGSTGSDDKSDSGGGKREPSRRAEDETDGSDAGSEPTGSPITVIAAILANATIMVAKFVMAAVSGSSAMLAEGVHSAVDTANQGLIILGIHRSRRPADHDHPFGYGKEIYFWALVYAGLLFAIGGGVSIYEGITSLSDPEPPTSYVANYVVLTIALVAEGISWVIAVRAIKREEHGRGFFDKLFRSKDPSRFVVVGEDSAAILGVVAAFIGLGLTQLTGSPYYDAAASVVIGLLLAASAMYLTSQTRHLLVGQSTDRDLLQRIHERTKARNDVEDTGEAFTMHVGPDAILVALDVRFASELSADDVARAVDDIEADIRRMDSRVERIFVEAQLRSEDIETPRAG